MDILIPDHTVVDPLILAGLESTIAALPPSAAQPAMRYDHSKLMKILMDKEIGELAGDDGLVERGAGIASGFGRISSMIRTAPDDVLPEYDRVESRARSELTGCVYLYTLQWGLSVKALYYYRKKDYNGALAYTLQCISLVEYLVHQGMRSLIFRCMEQNRNISRVNFVSGNEDEGCRHAGAILDYLLTGQNSGLTGSVFNEANWLAMPYVREGYAYHFFIALTHYFKDEQLTQSAKERLFDRLFGRLDFETNTPDRLIIYNWIYLKKKEIEGDYAGFVREFSDFMSEPICQIYDMPRIILFRDLARIVRKSGYLSKSTLLSKIDDYMKTRITNYVDLTAKTANSGPIAEIKIPIPGS